jgi:hypothetical protein
VDAHSHALRERAVTSTSRYDTVSSPGGGGESHGTGTFLGAPGDHLADALPDVLATLEPSVGVRATRSWTMGEALGRRPLLELDLRNVKSLRLPLRAAGRHRRERFRLSVASDGDTALSLRQLEPGRVVKVDGRRAGRAGPRARFTVRLGAGQHAVAL